MLAIIITTASKKEGMRRLRTKSLKLFSKEKKCSEILSSVKVFVSLQTKYYLYGKDN